MLGRRREDGTDLFMQRALTEDCFVTQSQHLKLCNELPSGTSQSEELWRGAWLIASSAPCPLLPCHIIKLMLGKVHACLLHFVLIRMLVKYKTLNRQYQHCCKVENANCCFQIFYLIYPFVYTGLWISSINLPCDRFLNILRQKLNFTFFTVF